MKKIISILFALLMLVSAFTFTVSAEEPFTDVKDSHWYYNAVNYCYDKGLMSGMTPTTFKPTGTVSREMFVKTLANMEGIDDEQYKNDDTPFKDVKTNAWYASAVEWARQTGIVAGLSETTFGVGKPVTREQIARLLRGYAEYKGKDVTLSADLSGFEDDNKINSWALDGFRYAVAMGIFKGNAKNELNPRGSATRAELATILKATRAYDLNKLVCWGDSLTQGVLTGGVIVDDPYPEKVASLINVPYLNFGIGGEKAETIAMRMGAIPIYVDDVTIPAECTPTPIVITAEGYNTEQLADNGDNGLNEVDIAGIKGSITWDSDHERHLFTRSQAGEELVITEPTQIVTAGMSVSYEDTILVIWSGTNNRDDWSDDPEAGIKELIKIQQAMVDYADTDKFVVMGIPAVGYAQSLPEYNYLLSEHWGEHFIDLNPYFMSEQIFTDLGITMRGVDRKDLADGIIPRSLLSSDYIHFNQQTYNVAADMIADKINELEYLN